MSKELLIGPGSCLNKLQEEERWNNKIKAFKEDPRVRNGLKETFIVSYKKEICSLEEEINKLMLKMIEKDHRINDLKFIIQELEESKEKE